MPILAVNKKANFDYEIIETYEAGMALFGHEVKSIKTGHISLKGAFVVLKKTQKSLPEVYLINAHVPLYKYAASQVKSYDPDRPRKLLLRKSEVQHLIGKKQEQGLTLVPLKIYTKHSLIKVEFGIGRGRKKVDKRDLIKKRDVERSLRTLTKRSK